MKIIIAHNRYQKLGGEDNVVDAEASVLRSFGNDVTVYDKNNSDIANYSLFGKINHFLKLERCEAVYQEFRDLLRSKRPDVVHVHNTFFMMTGAVYDACRDENVAVVQSLHNFRTVCANALFYRNNRVCEDCLKGGYFKGAVYRCYKKSFLLSFLVARMIKKHWINRTWSHKVDFFITGSEFTKKKLTEGGLPADRICVKPNFVDKETGRSDQTGDYALYVGRLSQEKGVQVLIKAWRQLNDVPLKVVGEGPLLESIKNENLENVELLGFVPHEKYHNLMKKAQFIIVPSVCYENFPRIIAEAFSYGLPVIASRLGSLEELVIDGQTGFQFSPNDEDDLVKKVRQLYGRKDLSRELGSKARKVYEDRFLAQKNYKLMMDIYTKALHRRLAVQGEIS